MPAKSEEIRNRKQRERQQKLRDADRKAKRPGRDDIARAALFMAISSMVARGAMNTLKDYQRRTVDILVEQGFDKQASDAVFAQLVDKYRDGASPFRRKPHLLYPDGGDQDG